MKSIQQLFRLLYINFVLARNGLDQVIVSIHLFAPFRLLVYLNPWNWRRKKSLTRGEAIRKTLEELGPIFIKFGQALSTRPDVLPADIAIELAKLQDCVTPFASDIALTTIEQAFGQSAFDLFVEFDTVPIASASIAQVHSAKLKSGKEVVVKILRPNIRKIIAQDLRILHTLSALAERYWLESRRYKPRQIIQEFECNLLHELDFMREAANSCQLRRNFKYSPLLYVPEIYWDYTRENILTMERIYGIPVSNTTALQQYGINIKKLAENGVEIFFTQVFRDCFFHADMHPGNIFVSTKNPENPQYICVDFGIMGTLNERDKRYLAENLYAFFTRDYRRVALLHIESGWVARDTRVDEFESAIRTICEPIFEKPLKDISFAQLVIRLFQTARRFNMEVQPQLILLQKTLVAIEGLGKQLYPELDLWQTAKPFLEKWLKEQIGPRAFIRQLKENIPFFMEHLPSFPKLVHETLQLYKEEKLLEKHTRHTQTRKNAQKRRMKYYYVGITVFFMMGLSASALLAFSQQVSLHQFAAVSGIIGVMGGVVALFNRK